MVSDGDTTSGLLALRNTLAATRGPWTRTVAVAQHNTHPAPQRLDLADTLPLEDHIPTPPASIPTAAQPVEVIDPRTAIERIQRGDAQAWVPLWNHYKSLVYRYVLGRVSNQQVAEDLTADTFLRAMKGISKFKWRGKDPGAWLITIARNLVTDHVRRVGREVVDSDTVEAIAWAAPGSESAEDTAIRLRRVRAVLAAIGGLESLYYQEVVILRFLHGLSIADTAAVLDKSEGAIKMAQRRALEAVAELLPEGIWP